MINEKQVLPSQPENGPECVYEPLPTVTREEAEAQLATARGTELVLLLLAMASLQDWKWVQETYFQYALHEDRDVANAAVLGLGHLARISQKIETEKVEAFLTDLRRKRPELKGTIENAMSDIEIYMRRSKP